MTRRVVVTGVGLISPVGIGTEANWEALLAGAVRHRADHALRSRRIRGAHCGRGQGLRPAAVHREEGRQEGGRLHPVRARRGAVRRRGRAAGGHRGQRRRRRRLHRLGHRRVLDDRARAQGAAEGRAAPHLPVLHSRVHHQSRRRAGVDPVRRARAEPGDLHRLHGVGARHRRGVRDHPPRRCRGDDRRRIRGRHHADGRRRVRRDAGPLDAQRRARAREPALRPRPGRLRHRRGRGHRRPRGTRGREASRRGHLRRDRRLRPVLRCLPPDGAAGGRQRRRPVDADGAAQGGRPARPGGLHQRARHVDADQRSHRDAGRQAVFRRRAPRGS